MPYANPTGYFKKRKRSRRVKRRANHRSKRLRYSKWRPTYVPKFKFKAPLGNFPSNKTVALRYLENFTLDASGSGSATQVFSVNSIFDPNVTGVGHQPMFRDNYANLYNTYRVNYSHITIIPLTTHVVNTTYSNDVGGTTVSQGQFYEANQRGCRLWILRDAATNDFPSNVDTLIEEGNTDFVWRYCPQNTSAKMPILKFSCWPAKLLNLSAKDDQLKAVQTVNPGAQAFYIVGISSIGAGVNPDPIACQAIITYNVTFSDPFKNQPQN